MSICKSYFAFHRDSKKFLTTYEHLQDNALLDALHWSPTSNAYADYGRHSPDVVLKREVRPPPPPGQRPPQHPPGLVRHARSEPTLRFVDSSFGYVSLFPLMLELLDPDSPRLGVVLTDLRNESLLWTKYGLRSLAKKSALYMKRNTEHDPPYWRGPIWINMNFLVLRALKSYSATDGPYRDQSSKLYQELRKNLIDNVFKEYLRTGYIWEQYNDSTGQGQGCRPFTGWSSLVVLMMSETF
jgi:mannosyl-oligosaccharide glucosidase